MALTTAQIQNAYVAFFNRPADVAGLTYWSTYAGSTADLLNTFAQSSEYKALYNGLNNTQTVNAVYQNLFGHTPDVAGLTYWVTQLDQGKLSIGNIADAINKGAQGTDATIISNKTTAATSFTAALDTTAKIVAYAGVSSTGLDAVKTWLNAVTSDSATLTNATSTTTLASITNTVLNNVGGTNYTLTTGVDNLTGTGGNDIFTADNTGTNPQLTAADQINGGAGSDTLKVYTKSGSAVTLGTLTSIETLYVNGDDQGLDVSTQSSITALQLDAYSASKTYTVKNQSVSLANHTAGGLTITIDSGSSASQALTVNAVGKTGAAETVDFKGTNTSASITATGTASTVALTNTGAKLATLTLSGDKALTLTGAPLSAATMTKIDASTATGNMSVDLTNAVTDKAFTFTGGAGNDTVKVRAAEFGTLTSGAQLDGGAGTDTLQINDTTPVYSALNKVTNFEVLQLGTDSSTVDIGQLTSFNKFSVAAGAFTETFNNAKSTSTFAIDNSSATTSVTIANKVGETSTTVAIDNGAGASKTLGTLTLTGVTNVALSSTGVATKAGGANVITTFNNADNSNITLTGDTALTLTLAGTSTGSKLDGSAFTAVLTATGSAKADVLIGGSANDVLTTNGGADTLTGNGGKDTFLVNGAAAGTAGAPVTITDFVSGTDLLQIQKGAGKVAVNGTPTVTSTKVDVSAATTLAAALDMAVAGDGSSTSTVKWLAYSGDVYVVVDNSASATLQTADAVIKLAGISTIATATDLAIV